MSDIKSIDEGFSEFISNPVGIPMDESDSQEIRNEHRKWKKNVQELKKGNSVEAVSYWQKVSSCTSL